MCFTRLTKRDAGGLEDLGKTMLKPYRYLLMSGDIMCRSFAKHANIESLRLWGHAYNPLALFFLALDFHECTS